MVTGGAADVEEDEDEDEEDEERDEEDGERAVDCWRRMVVAMYSGV